MYYIITGLVSFIAGAYLYRRYGAKAEAVTKAVTGTLKANGRPGEGGVVGNDK